jgi:predicted Zn-dependent protease
LAQQQEKGKQSLPKNPKGKKGSRPFRLGAVALLLAIALVSPWGRAPAAKEVILMSEADEVKVGGGMDKELEKQYGFCGSPKLQAYLDQLGQKVAAQAEPRGFRYSFKVLDDETINALALPGGYIYVTRGLLAVLNDEAELAGVIGHEVGHASSRHAAKQMTKATLFQLLSLGALAAAASTPEGRVNMGAWVIASNEFFTQILLGYGRDNEMEADEKGMRYAFQAGYDPRCMAQFLRYLRTKEQLSGINFQGFYLTHPETAERIIKSDTLGYILASGSKAGELEVGANRYRSQLEGLPYGHKDDRRTVQIYTAKAGDSLPSICRALLGDESRSHEVAFLNRLKEGAKLEEGMVLKIPSR